MGQTPNSSTSSYITVDQFIMRHDYNAVAMLSVDDGSKPTQAELETNANLLQILMDASGMVEVALMTNERYSTVDLSAPNGVSQAYMQSIISDIAMYKLYCRRDAPGPPETVISNYNEALRKIDQLRTGDVVLSFAESQAAGIPTDEFMQIGDLFRDNLFSTACRRTLGIRNAFRRGIF